MDLRVATWNVLCDAYVEPEYFPHTPAAILDPDRRRAALLDRIRSLDVDILCLQEVDAGLAAAIRAVGLDGRYAPKGGGKPDGCATVSRLPVRSERTLAYADGSGHVALFVELDGVTVANTHLKWDPEGTRGARQIAELLEGRPERFIVCGDFNAEAASETVSLCLAAGLRDACPAGGATSNANGRAKRIDYLFHSLDLRAAPALLPRIADDTPLPSESEPSDHLAVRATFTS